MGAAAFGRRRRCRRPLLVCRGGARRQRPGHRRRALQFLGIPVDFILFGLTLLGVALFHHHTLSVALAGLAIIVGYKLAFT
ncbi:MAG: citrate transporter, partial [Rhodoplanes sp.]